MFLILGLGLAAALGIAMVLAIKSPRETDGRSQAVAGFNVFWGVVTMLFFAPAGCLAALMAFDRAPIGGIAIGLVSLDGFALGIALFVAARRLLKLHKLEKVKSIAYWSFVHHAAVVVAFVLAMGAFDDLALFTTIPCAIGAALAFGLIRRVDRDRAAAEKEGVLEPDPDKPQAF